MKPLFVLLISFCIAVLGVKIFLHKYDFGFSARIALSVMMLFTAIAHFAFPRGMAMMIPDFIPYKLGIVYLTGIIELAAASGLLIPGVKVLAGWLLIAFFILILPANINAAYKQVDYQKGTYSGDGPKYLWFRIPLQIFFIVWTYLSIK